MQLGRFIEMVEVKKKIFKFIKSINFEFLLFPLTFAISKKCFVLISQKCFLFFIWNWFGPFFTRILDSLFLLLKCKYVRSCHENLSVRKLAHIYI